MCALMRGKSASISCDLFGRSATRRRGRLITGHAFCRLGLAEPHAISRSLGLFANALWCAYSMIRNGCWFSEKIMLE
jgi:hypothetical protein